jgi:hypothetical protein
MTWWKTLAAVVLAATLGTSTPARAGYLEDAGWGALSALSNVAYIPAKLCYSLLGGLTGGMAYGLTMGDLDTAQNIWTTSMGGTYVVTPRMLKGEDPVAFAYYPPTQPAPAAAATIRDDADWSAAEIPSDSLDGSSLGSTSPSLEEQPAAGF